MVWDSILTLASEWAAAYSSRAPTARARSHARARAFAHIVALQPPFGSVQPFPRSIHGQPISSGMVWDIILTLVSEWAAWDGHIGAVAYR